MPLDADEQRVIDDIEQFGWHAVIIEEDDRGPGFNYSIGLMDRLAHPEIIMFGLDHRLMHDVMWGMVRDIESGRRFDDGHLYEDLLDGCACSVRRVHPTQHASYLGYGMWYMRQIGRISELEAVQLFWPGKIDGLFPWEQDCSHEVIRRQPLLYLSNDADGA